MEHRVPTIFEVAEQAAREQRKAQPERGQHKLKPARKASHKTSRRPAARKPRKPRR